MISAAALLLILIMQPAGAADWPTHLHDNHCSGYTSENLQLPMQQQWVTATNRPPRPAWSETPAGQDFWQNYYNNKSRVPVESAFHIVVAGQKLYCGSSSSDKLLCRSNIDGGIVWRFFTGGPVRMSPSVCKGKVYFGSDDGYAYCLDAEDGRVERVRPRRTSNAPHRRSHRDIRLCCCWISRSTTNRPQKPRQTLYRHSRGTCGRMCPPPEVLRRRDLLPCGAGPTVGRVNPALHERHSQLFICGTASVVIVQVRRPVFGGGGSAEKQRQSSKDKKPKPGASVNAVLTRLPY